MYDNGLGLLFLQGREKYLAFIVGQCYTILGIGKGMIKSEKEEPGDRYRQYFSVT